MMWRKTAGQSVIEYLILVAVIAVASLGIAKVLGSTVSAKLAQITLALQGKHKEAEKIKIPDVKKEHWKPRGMEDFYESPD